MGQGALAEEQYRYLIDSKEKIEQAYLDLGYLYEKQRKWDKALALFQEALANNPYDLSLRHHVARIYVKMQDFERALSELQQIV